MASTPQFTSAVKTGRAVVTAATTDKTGATVTNIVDILSAGASGTQIRKLVVKATGQPADSIVLIFLHNGTDYRMVKEVDIGAPAAGSTTVAAYEQEVNVDWVIPSGWKMAAAVTVIPTAGNIVVFGFGGDF